METNDEKLMISISDLKKVEKIQNKIGLIWDHNKSILNRLIEIEDEVDKLIEDVASMKKKIIDKKTFRYFDSGSYISS